jgi:acyl-CoA thioester hydrolase
MSESPRRVRVPLRFRDLDYQGHVYHATVLTLLDEARTVWLGEEIGVSDADATVVARIEIDYLAEIRLSPREVEVEIGVQRVGRSSLTTVELLRADEKAAARAVVTVVMWDRVAGRKRLLTDDERDRAERVRALSPHPGAEPG